MAGMMADPEDRAASEDGPQTTARRHPGRPLLNHRLAPFAATLILPIVLTANGAAAQTDAAPEADERAAATTGERATPGGDTDGASGDQAQYDGEEDEDGRTIDLLWVEALVGYSYVDLVQFSHDNFLPEVKRLAAAGPAFGMAAGVKVAILSIGLRGTLGTYSDFDVGTAVLDLALRLPVFALEPYLRGGVGLAWIGSANLVHPSGSETTVNGVAIEAGAGVNIFLGSTFAVGAGLDAVFLDLTRERVATGCLTGDCRIDAVNFEDEGAAAGLGVRGHLHASLHF